MYDTPAVSLVPVSTTALAMERMDPSAIDAAVTCGFAFTSMFSVLLFLAGMPLVSMGVLALTGVTTLLVESVLAARRRRRAAIAVPDISLLEVPERISGRDAREAYRAILNAYAEIQRVLTETVVLRGSATTVLERCGTAVQQCSRLAALCNPLQRYLDAHDRSATAADAERLEVRREIAADPLAQDALDRAAKARARQLETHDEIACLRERICARLELVRAALESFAATIVKLHVTGEEQRVVSGESVIENLEGVADELDVIETELALDLSRDLADELAA